MDKYFENTIARSELFEQGGSLKILQDVFRRGDVGPRDTEDVIRETLCLRRYQGNGVETFQDLLQAKIAFQKMVSSLSVSDAFQAFVEEVNENPDYDDVQRAEIIAEERKMIAEEEEGEEDFMSRYVDSGAWWSRIVGEGVESGVWGKLYISLQRTATYQWMEKFILLAQEQEIPLSAKVVDIRAFTFLLDEDEEHDSKISEHRLGSLNRADGCVVHFPRLSPEQLRALFVAARDAQENIEPQYRDSAKEGPIFSRPCAVDGDEIPGVFFGQEAGGGKSFSQRRATVIRDVFHNATTNDVIDENKAREIFAKHGVDIDRPAFNLGGREDFPEVEKYLVK